MPRKPIEGKINYMIDGSFETLTCIHKYTFDGGCCQVNGALYRLDISTTEIVIVTKSYFQFSNEVHMRGWVITITIFLWLLR
jgi:hypothetical protein